MNYSKTILGGRMTKDLDLRTAPSGVQMASGCIAVNGPKRAGHEQDVLFMEFIAYGDRAVSLAKHHHKGSTVLLEGRLKIDKWVDRETQQKRERMKLVVDSWSFCGAPGSPASESGSTVETTESSSTVALDDVVF